jgi:hypothetical protein
MILTLCTLKGQESKTLAALIRDKRLTLPRLTLLVTRPSCQLLGMDKLPTSTYSPVNRPRPRRSRLTLALTLCSISAAAFLLSLSQFTFLGKQFIQLPSMLSRYCRSAKCSMSSLVHFPTSTSAPSQIVSSTEPLQLSFEMRPFGLGMRNNMKSSREIYCLTTVCWTCKSRYVPQV